MSSTDSEYEYQKLQDSEGGSRETGPIIYARKPIEVVLSKFVLVQCAMNMFASASCSVVVFWLLFAVVEEGPYPWNSPNLIGVVIGSSIFVSPMLVMVLAPISMPEANKEGWYPVLRVSDCPGWMLTLFPFLRPSGFAKNGSGRHLLVGVVQSTVMITVPILLAYFLFRDDEMSTWTLIGFNLIFEVILAIPCTIFGLLGFAMEHNFVRVQETMSMHPVWWKRLLERVNGGFKLLC